MKNLNSRCLEVLCEFVSQFSRRVDGEDSGHGNSNCSVGVGIISTIAISSKKRVLPLEKGLDILETSDFELLGISVNDFSLEGVNKRVWVEKERPLGQADVSLLQGLQIVLGDGGLANGPGTEVHDLVSVIPDLAVQLGHPRLGPVPAYDGKEVTEDVRLGDGAVNVGYDDLVGVMPQVDTAQDTVI